jgi:hypothetical protein
MTAVGVSGTRAERSSAKLLKVARHRVLRWFRPPEAELVRRRLVPHPMPGVPPASTEIREETRREQCA